ncbi:alpha-L-fucosidase [Mucilaginibacter sabulilitoris]|uniref:alpha-L-fucosidase n=1 Tax=Mucilaginibacter sabulilitoris TaxID=1173583 RepID=A0ABZ0TVF2_9SPHI|nr:alpha-L-fucosidase [Mucilaginibacter sabulilitoris]WPU97076.1 alpha-L-fucosidase [Mucilaginibacter sabulilitoris]
MKRLALLLFTFFSLAASAQTFEPNWASLNMRKMPAWFHQDKFGIFIHWGLYSVPAYAPVIPNSGYSYAEWYWQRIATEKQKDFVAFHNKNYGADFLYPQFEPMFKAEMFDPQQWAQVFKNSGARYVVLTSKHHEGYCLWNSAEADRDWGRSWNAVSGTPKRDLLGDLTNAVRQEGLKMGYYYSLYEWYNPLWLKDKKRFVTEHMIPQFKDLVTKYKPSIIFSDGEWELPDTAWHSPELLAWLFNESPVAKEVVVDDRWGSNTRDNNKGATYTTSEYGSGKDASVIWEESQGIGHSYGYNRNEKLEDYKSGHDLILMLIDIVSRGGNLLLDIGPTADGRIPVIMQQRLSEIGSWLKLNGEAIYETEAYKQPYQWSNGIRREKKGKSYMAGYSITQLVKPQKDTAYVEAFFTVKNKDLFCILPTYTPTFKLRNFHAKANGTATILGTGKSLKLKNTDKDCVIDLSGLKPGDASAELIVLKLNNAL